MRVLAARVLVIALVSVSPAWSNSVLGQVLDLPKVTGVEVDAFVLVEPGSDILRYSYRLRHTGSQLSVLSFAVDISTDETRADLTSEGLSFADPHLAPATQLNLSRLGAARVVPVGSKAAPGVWAVGVDAEAALGWSTFKGLLDPGETLEGFVLTSRGLPGIRSAKLAADLEDFMPNVDDPAVTAGIEDVVREVKESPQVVPTVGPVAPPKDLDLPSFVDEIDRLRAQARKEGWIQTDEASKDLARRLSDLKTALAAQQNAQARTVGQRLLKKIDALSCKQLSCPDNPPLTSEGFALMHFNVAFVLDSFQSQ